MGQQIAARLYRWRRYSGGVRQCERTSVKSGASIMQRGGDRRPKFTPDAVVSLAPLADGNQLDTGRNVTFICDVSKGETFREIVASLLSEKLSCLLMF